jgi:hypothetical protein
MRSAAAARGHSNKEPSMIQRMILALGLAAFATAGANTLPVPKVEYSADRTIETTEGTVTGKVYSAKDKERSEMNMMGMQMVMILRMDRDLAWMLMPGQRMYQEVDLSSAKEQTQSGLPEDVTITAEGTETLAGMKTTKYRMVTNDRSASGFLWVNDDGILLKMDMVAKEDGENTRVTVTLSNLKVGPQDASLFELPPGYKKLPSMGFPGMDKMPGMGGR